MLGEATPLTISTDRIAKPTSKRRRPPIVRWIVGIVAFFLAVIAAIWWEKTSHVDQQGRLPQPTVAINVPRLLLQATGRQDGMHLICMTGYPSKLGFYTERRTYLHEPGYQLAQNYRYGDFRCVLLTKKWRDFDTELSPFVAFILPYWSVVTFFSVMSAGCVLSATRSLFRYCEATSEQSPPNKSTLPAAL